MQDPAGASPKGSRCAKTVFLYRTRFAFDTVMLRPFQLPILVYCGRRKCRYWYIAVVAIDNAGTLRSSSVPIPVHCGRRKRRYQFIAVIVRTDQYWYLAVVASADTVMLRSSLVPISVYCGRRKCNIFRRGRAWITWIRMDGRKRAYSR